MTLSEFVNKFADTYQWSRSWREYVEPEIKIWQGSRKWDKPYTDAALRDAIETKMMDYRVYDGGNPFG